MDLSKSMTLVFIQKEVERKHYNIYNDKYTWYDYRAHLLGYSTKDIIEAMQKVNKQHHSIRASLVQLDANELIRTGVIDLMLCLGKTQEYATNVGNLCKSIAQKVKYGNIIWDDTKENPLQLNQSDVNDKKNTFNKSLKQLSK
jgi:NCAIR mutase (PurE)-related protein